VQTWRWVDRPGSAGTLLLTQIPKSLNYLSNPENDTRRIATQDGLGLGIE